MQLETQKIIGFIDLGTNSVRLLVVRLNPNGSYAILTQQKEVIRLGEGGYIENCLTAQAIERATTTITRLIDLARSRGTEEFVAVATSAAREASNGEELCTQIEDLSGVRINIISGKEEARLIWLGVSSAIDIRGEKALFIDIGGGSTEIIVGDQHEPCFLRSLKLGAIRTTDTILKQEKDGKINGKSLITLRRHIKQQIVHIAKNTLTCNVKKAFGSSGTILSLETIAGSYKPFLNDHINGFLSTDELGTVITYLASLPLQVRREVAGLNPDRAEIIIAGAVILHEILKTTNISGIQVSSRSLRDGLLVDYLSKIPGFPHEKQVPVREQSVGHLGKVCHIDEKHADHVARVALQLYHSGKKTGLFTCPDEAEELLKHAAYLHDIGQFISFSDHHQHSYYLITEGSLLGFNQHEVRIIGLIARYHRKKLPKSHDIPFQELGRDDRRLVRILALLLRFAENLDRNHDQRIEKAEFVRKKGVTILRVSCRVDSPLELWAVESEKDSFFRTFRSSLQITTSPDKSEFSNLQSEIHRQDP